VLKGYVSGRVTLATFTIIPQKTMTKDNGIGENNPVGFPGYFPEFTSLLLHTNAFRNVFICWISENSP